MDEKIEVTPKAGQKRSFKEFLKKAKYSYRSLPDKKQYVEFFTALLTVPVLLTVIILNVSNLLANKEKEVPTPTPVKQIIYVSPTTNTDEEEDLTPTPTVSTECKKEIGPISIDTPRENETVTDNPVTVTVNYKRWEYCAVVWQYRINNGRWSDYDDKSISLFGMSNGEKKLELRVKSLANGDEKILERTFNYQGASEPTATTAPTPTTTE